MVMAHIGFTPQSEHRLAGHRVQGCDADAEELLQDALAVEGAGAVEAFRADVASGSYPAPEHEYE